MTAERYPGPSNATLSEEECLRTHPGFTITCQACGGQRVIVTNTLGFSAESGAWGEVLLDCMDCGADCTLVEP